MTLLRRVVINVLHCLQEHLKGKDRRRMRANQLVGKSANYKVRALADVVHIKRRGKQQH